MRAFIRHGLTVLLTATFLACQMPTARVLPALIGPQAGSPGTAAAAQMQLDRDIVVPSPLEVAPVKGRVDFGNPTSSDYQVQSNVSDITLLATVSVIDVNTGQTMTAGVTDTNGNFSLPFSTFVPADNSVYVLEAIRGVSGGAPGNDAPRFRTVIQYSGGNWKSITNATVGGSIVINALTSAIALCAGLDTANPKTLPYSGTIGMVNAAVSPPSLSGSPALPATFPAAKVLQMQADLLAIVTANLDPVSETDALNPSVESYSPNVAPANSPVLITGQGFVRGNTTVTIGGASAPILAWKRISSGGIGKWQIVVSVPSDAITGNLVVTTARGGSVTAGAFTIPDGSRVGITSISPNPARPGSTITLNGTGFSMTLASNVVRLNGVTLTPIFANQTTLVVQVPDTSTSGNMTVSVGSAISNVFYLSVDTLITPRITSVFPTIGGVKSTVLLKGVNFGPTGRVIVGGYEARVISWNPKAVRIEIPWYLATGASQITLFSPFGISTATFNVIAGHVETSYIDTGTNLATGTAVGGNGTHVWIGDAKLWAWGGGTTAVKFMNLNPDGSFKDANWTLSSLQIPSATNQDDSPNDDVLVRERIYYTVSNSSNRINFASLDPYTGDITAFGYDPTNDLPSNWRGRDLALAASDKYVYIGGQGVSCSGSGLCDGSATATKQTRILPSGGIGIWEAGTSQLYYGEDAYFMYIGGVLHMLSGNDIGTTGGSQYTVLDFDGKMTNWIKNPTSLVPVANMHSTKPVRIGRYYYLLNPDAGGYRGEIVDDLVPKPVVRYAVNGTNISVVGGHMKQDIAIGKYFYTVSSYSGWANQYKTYRYTIN